MFDDLNRYDQTMHFNGQSTVTIDGTEATGDSYTIAHHVYTEEGTRMMMVAWLRYLDRFTKVDRLGISQSARSSSSGARCGPSVHLRLGDGPFRSHLHDHRGQHGERSRARGRLTRFVGRRERWRCSLLLVLVGAVVSDVVAGTSGCVTPY